MRATLFRALLPSGRPVSAYDAAEAVSLAEGRRIAVATVYRMLALFVARRIVSRVESLSAYIVNDEPGSAIEGFLLICGRCGRVRHAMSQALCSAAEIATRGAGFAQVRLIAEVHGFCDSCGPHRS